MSRDLQVRSPQILAALTDYFSAAKILSRGTDELAFVAGRRMTASIPSRIAQPATWTPFDVASSIGTPARSRMRMGIAIIQATQPRFEPRQIGLPRPLSHPQLVKEKLNLKQWLLQRGGALRRGCVGAHRLLWIDILWKRAKGLHCLSLCRQSDAARRS